MSRRRFGLADQIKFTNFLRDFTGSLIIFQNAARIAIFGPSTVFLDELPDTLGEYCVAKAAAEVYSDWVVKNRPRLRIACPRLPRLATDQTASISVTDYGDMELMLELLRDFSKLGSNQ